HPQPDNTAILTLSLHDALPISTKGTCTGGAILNCNIGPMAAGETVTITLVTTPSTTGIQTNTATVTRVIVTVSPAAIGPMLQFRDRKSTRLNSSHDQTSYAVFC